MADSPSDSPSGPVSRSNNTQYWCYHCDKHVSVETLANLPDIICFECKNGFVESIVATSPSLVPAPVGYSSDLVDDTAFGSEFLQVLRLIAQPVNDDDGEEPPPSPPEHAAEDDFLRIELDGWDNDPDDDNEDVDGVEIHNDDEDDDGSDNENDENQDHPQTEEEDMRRRRRRDVLRLRIRDIATHTRSGRNRILDWAEILMGLDDNSIELRLQVPESDRYIGNPQDYVDASQYEALLQNLAESDGGRRGAPPASKLAISALQSVEIVSEKDTAVCAICKDMIIVGETAKKLPCGHGYHGDCIGPWVASRNSCPVCRFELPTDDQEYEEEKRKRLARSCNACGTSSSSSAEDNSS